MVDGALAGAALSTVSTPASRAMPRAASIDSTGDSSCASSTPAAPISAALAAMNPVLSEALAPGPMTMELRPRLST